jgi:hypothetical protein
MACPTRQADALIKNGEDPTMPHQENMEAPVASALGLHRFQSLLHTSQFRVTPIQFGPQFHCAMTIALGSSGLTGDRCDPDSSSCSQCPSGCHYMEQEPFFACRNKSHSSHGRVLHCAPLRRGRTGRRFQYRRYRGSRARMSHGPLRPIARARDRPSSISLCAASTGKAGAPVQWSSRRRG